MGGVARRGSEYPTAAVRGVMRKCCGCRWVVSHWLTEMLVLFGIMGVQ